MNLANVCNLPSSQQPEVNQIITFLVYNRCIINMLYACEMKARLHFLFNNTDYEGWFLYQPLVDTPPPPTPWDVNFSSSRVAGTTMMLIPRWPAAILEIGDIKPLDNRSD